jgi:hypothetical protein
LALVLVLSLSRHAPDFIEKIEVATGPKPLLQPAVSESVTAVGSIMMYSDNLTLTYEENLCHVLTAMLLDCNLQKSGTHGIVMRVKL